MTDIVAIDDLLLLTLERNQGRLAVDTLFGKMRAAGVQDVDTRAAIWRLKRDGVILHRGNELELMHK